MNAAQTGHSRVEVTILFDAKKLHRFLRSLLVAGASLLIIASAAFAGNALAPASPATVISPFAAEHDRDDVDDGDLDAPRVETPGADDADETEVDDAEGMPTAEDVERDSEAQEGADQSPTENGNDTNEDQDDNEDADEAEDDDADEADDDADDGDEANDDGGAEDDSDDSDDSGEDDD